MDSPQPLKATTNIGSRVPATVTSTGKALLAWLPKEALDQAMEHARRFTPLSLVRRRDVEKDLDDTRTRGYAINRGEFRAGVCGIAAPIRDRDGMVVASINVWGAEMNILGARRDELARFTMIAAGDVSRQLGYLPPGATRRIVSGAADTKGMRRPN